MYACLRWLHLVVRGHRPPDHMPQSRLSFESTMSALGQFSTPEANHLTITALEAVDSMNKALEGYHQVSHLIGS